MLGLFVLNSFLLCNLLIENVVNLLRGRTHIDSFTRNVQWTFGGGGGKRTGRFQKFCFIDISPENFLQETLFCSFRLLYILLM